MSEPTGLADQTAANSRQIVVIIAIAALVYFACSSIRYWCFRPEAFDLGIFDQAVYLISQGRVPYSTIISMHILADHASLLFYPLALFYRIYPSVLWLFAFQAIGLTAAAWPVYRLARLGGLSFSAARALAIVFLIYPTNLMANLRDFHCEIFFVPAILAAMLCVRTDRIGWFIFWIAFALSTKEVLSLTVAMTGVWLLLCHRKRAYGTIALVMGGFWFVFSTHWLIPHFGAGHQYNGYRFFSYMGATPGQIVKTMVTHPVIPLRQVLSPHCLMYLASLALPVIWGLSPRYLLPMLPALPTLAINLLSNVSAFQSPLTHYSVAIGPFVFLSIIAALSAGRGWMPDRRGVVIWLVALFLIIALDRAAWFSPSQLHNAVTDSGRSEAIDLIDDGGGVLATRQITPHLTHRVVCQYIFDPDDPTKLYFPKRGEIDWVLLDYNEDSLQMLGQYGRDFLDRYQSDPSFRLVLEKNGVYLFHRIRPEPQATSDRPVTVKADLTSKS